MSLLTSFRDASIKRKLTLISLLTSGLALLYITLILAVSGWADRRADAVSDWTTFARVIGANATTAMLFDDADAATKTLAALAASPDIADAVIYDNAGKMFARYLAPQRDTGVLLHRVSICGAACHSYTEPGSHLFSTHRLVLSEPIEFKGKALGSIHLEVDLLDLYADFLRDAGLVFLIALSAFLASLFLFEKLQKTIVDPLAELSDRMEKVSAGQDYALRVEVHGKDEVGRLARGFNGMLEHIQQRDTELARHREHLEEEVAQRTASLRESEERFRKSFQHAAIGMALVGLDGQWLKVNDSLCQITGYAEHELLGRTFQDITHPDDLQADLGFVAQLLAGETDHYQMEKRYFHKDGHVVWIRLSVSLIKDEQGKPIHFVSQIDDITERKLAEKDLRLFKELIEKSNDALFINDAETSLILDVNEQALKNLGYTREELLGMRVTDIEATLPEKFSWEKHMRELDAAGFMLLEGRHRRKDGVVFPVEISVSNIQVGNGKFNLAIVRDITERKRVEEQIRQLNEELEAKVQERTRQLLEAQEELVRKEKLAVLGQVAGSVGHELRNPLGVMSNAVYFLQTVLPDADETVKEYLDIIKNEIAGSERIVSDLLDSVRTKPPHPEMVGVAELIGQTLRKVTVPAPVTVKLDIPATLSPLRVDGMQIGQVLRNFISNGVEAMPEGGVLEIRAVENKPEKTIAVSVRDSGIGMTPEQLGKLFQPLFTTKARGIGLGLVVVKNLTEANGGTVKVESEPGKGTTFTVTLPAANEMGVSI